MREKEEVRVSQNPNSFSNKFHFCASHPLSCLLDAIGQGKRKQQNVLSYNMQPMFSTEKSTMEFKLQQQTKGD